MQKKESTTTQHKTEAAAATSTATPVSQQSLAPPPLQLQASGVIQEKKETEAGDQTSMPSNYLVASAAGDAPNDGNTPNSNTNKNSNTSQLKQAIPPFQAPVQQKVASPSFPPFQAPVQKKAATNDIPSFQAPVQKKSGAGNMPEDVRGKMENAFQADFSNVNVHQNSQSATDVGALAYTQGNDVHFAPGQFKPNTNAGQELIGHELTHVVQQREGRVKPTTQAKGMPVNDNPGLEQEADVMGRKAAQFKMNTAASPPSNAIATSVSGHTNTIQKQPKRRGGRRAKEENSPEISNDFNTDPGWNDVGETGIVYQETGANLRATPIPGQGLIRNLRQNEKVSILKHNPTTKWYAVITAQSEIGYVADHLIWKNLPDYNTRVLQVEGGTTALDIAFEHYGQHFNSWGEDARFVVNALVYANNSTPQNGTGNKGIFNNSNDWENAQLTANAYIWLPSVEFIRSLKGTVGSGSITNDLWEGAKDIAKGAALAGAFTAGIFHGAFDGFVTMIKDAAEGIWDIVKGIFTGTIIQDIKNMIDAILKLTWEDLMEMLLGWTEPWIEKTKSDNVFVKGHAYGYITGRILFEVISMFIGGGAVIKIIGKFGKLGKAIAGVINKVGDAVQNISGSARQRIRDLIPNRQNPSGPQHPHDLGRGVDEPSSSPDVDVEDVTNRPILPQDAANWSEVENFIGRHIDSIEQLPNGYRWSTSSNGRRIIQRVEADDSRFVRLTVDENGNIQTHGRRNPESDTGLSTQQKGIIGERRADEFMSDEGYTKIGGHGDTPQGIDGVYENSTPPPRFVVGEAKYGSSTLGTLVDGTRQMSDQWINDRLVAAVGREMADEILLEGYTKWILRYNPDTNTVIQSVLD